MYYILHRSIYRINPEHPQHVQLLCPSGWQSSTYERKNFFGTVRILEIKPVDLEGLTLHREDFCLASFARMIQYLV